MSIHVALNHVTHYRYDRRVTLGPQIVRLRPAPHCRTRILSYSLRVTPAEHFINWQQDPQSNYLARLVYRSNLLGRDQRITNTGGGNTSSKLSETDPLTGETVEVLWVKGSGGDLPKGG